MKIRTKTAHIGKMDRAARELLAGNGKDRIRFGIWATPYNQQKHFRIAYKRFSRVLASFSSSLGSEGDFVVGLCW